MKIKLAILFIIFPLLAEAQVGMGEWRTYFAYNEVAQVEETPTQIFGICSGALFSVNKEDNSIETYSKINGQNDFDISFIRYNTTTGSLLISYANGNIDLLSSGSFSNIPDIEKKAVTVDKTTNDIIFDNEYAYISNGIGIVVLNLKKKEITDTYLIGANSTTINVKSVAFFNDSIYALTATGIYSASKTNKLLVDYNNWKYRTNTILSSTTNQKLVAFNNNLYLLKSSGEVYSSSNAINWTLFNNTQTFTGLRVTDKNLILSSSNSVSKYNQSLQIESLTGLKINDAIYNNTDNIYWLATSDSTGIAKVQNGSIVQLYKPDGPATNKIFNIKKQGDRLYATTGGKWEAASTGILGAIMIFENNSWKKILEKDIKPYTNKSFTDITQIAIDATDPQHFFVSTYGSGVYEFKKDAYFLRHYSANSGIQNTEGDDWQIVDGLCFDSSNNLWMNNDMTTASIKVLQNNGKWLSLEYAPISGTVNGNSFDKIIITDNNFKWLNRPRGGGVFVLDDKSAPASRSSHQYKAFATVIDQDGNNISLDRVVCINKDNNDNVWIGTTSGPIVFENIDNVFNSDYTVLRPKISRNDGTDYADYLLDGQVIRWIEVDGANRKWIGTESSGVYLMSEDGLETIHHFTTDNSPLLSNSILSISIDNKSGEVFFATDMGLISYMSDAAESQESYSNISIYPNPVRENFDGIITIAGLMDNTTVKITDTNGNLVYQTKSNGGIATWNGKTHSGMGVSSGVYFVMCSNASDKVSSPSTGVGKIMIIK